MVDGTTQLGALFRILLPLSLPGIAAVGIFTFTAAWNELLFALIFITSEDLRTVPLGLNYLITGDVLLWGPIMAGRRFGGGTRDDPLLPGPALHGAGHDGRLSQGVAT
jgi:ABC-type glycerol-3-phosphate transport system permease component